MAYWLLRHKHGLLRWDYALHWRSLERRHLCQPLQLLLRSPWRFAEASLWLCALPHCKRKGRGLWRQEALLAELSLLRSGHPWHLDWPGLPLDLLSMPPDSIPLLGYNFHIRDVDFQCLLLGFKIGTKCLRDLAQSGLWNGHSVGRLPCRWVIIPFEIDPTPRVMKCPQ